MRFEEVLPMLREGKKAINNNFGEKGDYWLSGYIGLIDIFDDNGKLIKSPKTLTIHRINKKNEAYNDKNSWGIPLYLIMDDSWKIIE